jgi:hypothetical protein
MDSSLKKSRIHGCHVFSLFFSIKKKYFTQALKMNVLLTVPQNKKQMHAVVKNL